MFANPPAARCGLFIPEGGGTNPWEKKNPVWKLKHPTRWMVPGAEQPVTFAKWTEYIKLNYYHYKVGDSQNKRLDYDNVIDRHPDIANGWNKESLRQMMQFFCGTAVILGGLLRAPAARSRLDPG